MKTAVLVLFLILAVACGNSKNDESPASPPAFEGIFSMSMNLSAVDSNDAIYQSEYTEGYNIGMRGAQTVISWCSENTDFNYAPAIYLATNNGYGLTRLSSQGFKILVTIPIIAISTKCAPPRVSGDAFNTTAMKNAYRAFLDQILPFIDSNVLYVSFGNEVDTYFNSHPSEWPAYKELVEDAATYVKSSKPWIKTGVTVTFEGASGSHQSNVQALNENMDIYILTYYPHSGNFIMEDPTIVEADMDSAVALAGSKPLVYQEFGYPSHVDLNASEAKQWQFFDLGLSKWKSFGSTKIPFLSAFKRRDYFNDVPSCGSIGTNYNKFLCSLGFVNNDLSEKIAWANIQSKLASLGFP